MNKTSTDKRTTSFSKSANHRGFTLIEVLVVVVILGILGAVIVPNLLSRPDEARVSAAQGDIRMLASQLDMYRLHNHNYPSSEQGLESLAGRPSGFPEPKNYPIEPYIKKLKNDPWDTPYQYFNTGSGFELFSFGADHVEGGEGIASDIYFKDL